MVTGGAQDCDRETPRGQVTTGCWLEEWAMRGLGDKATRKARKA